MVTMNKAYELNLQKEADFWGKMAEERWKGGIPLTMDFQLATRYRVKRGVLGWGDYIQDPKLESLTPFGASRKKIIEFAKKSKGKRVLDLFCGAGFLSLELARAGKLVDAVDCSEREVNLAKKYQSQLKQQPSGKINWIIADLNNYELPVGEYDLVTAWDGLHHMLNIDRLCEQIHNSLKPGGMFLFSERVWGGKEQNFKTRVGQGLETTLNVCLPLTWSYSKRLNDFRNMLKFVYNKYVLRREFASDTMSKRKESEYVSPFENSTGKEMLPTIEKNFEIDKIHNFGAFSEEACRSLNLPRILRIPSILFLSWFDYFWIKIGILEGKLIVGYAKKHIK